MKKYSIAINIFERSQKSAITCTFEMIHVCSMEIFWEIFCHLWQKNQQRAISWAKKDTEWVPKTHFCWNQYVISHFEFMLIIIFLSDFEDRKQWHNLPWFLRKIKVQKSTNWEHYFYVSNWTRGRHFMWSSEPHEGLAACSAEGVPSFLSYFY